jgi:hypothetical protein
VGVGNMAHALRDYVKPELLEGGNKYECDVCQCRRESHRRVVLKSVPPVLTFSCQRFDIDRTTWQRVKVTSEFRFPLMFSMQPFIDSGSRSGGNSGRSSCGSSESFEGVAGEKLLWLDDAIARAKLIAARLVDSYGGDAEAIVSEQLRDCSSYLYQSLYKEMCNPCDNTNIDCSDIYQLFAVIMHHGTAYSGHYSAYIRDVLQEGKWASPDAVDKDDTVNTIETVEETDIILPDNLCYVLQSDGNNLEPRNDSDRTYLVLENSPLHIILTLMSSITHSTISLVDLKASLEKNLGNKKWNSVFQSKFGTLPSFIEHHSMFLKITPPHQSNSKRGGRVSVQRNVRYNVLAHDLFKNAAAFYSNDDLLAFFCPPIVDSPSESGRKSDKVADDSIEWQTGGGRKRKAKKSAIADFSRNGTDHNEKVASEDNFTEHIDESAEFPCTQPSPAEVSLVHMLLGTFHGSFFNFNDSSVTPVPLSELSTAFNGNSSAYILIYRNRNLERYATTSSDNTKGLNIHGLRHPVPRCPPYWQAKVNIMNEELLKTRCEYDTYIRTIHLTVWFPVHFSSHWPVLRRRDEQGEFVLGGVLPSTGVCMTFDNLKTVEDLCVAIFEKVRQLYAGISGPATISDSLLMQALHLPQDSGIICNVDVFYSVHALLFSCYQ